jgi:hypothetical protein
MFKVLAIRLDRYINGRFWVAPKLLLGYAWSSERFTAITDQ